MDLDSSVVERSYVKREAQGSMPGFGLCFSIIHAPLKDSYRCGQVTHNYIHILTYLFIVSYYYVNLIINYYDVIGAFDVTHFKKNFADSLMDALR